VATRCRELGRKEPDATSLLFTALLERKAYREIGSLWAQLQPSIPAWPERQQLIVGGLRGIALYGQGDEVEAQPFVRRLYETRSLPAQTLTVLAGQLDKVGQKAEAHRVLRHAVEIDPLYQPATTLLLRKLLAENQLEEAPALIDRLLTMRKPPADLLAELAQVLSSDLYLFQPGKERAQAKIKAYQDRTAPLAGP
jgi:Flp pilus assembly protein TadD